MDTRIIARLNAYCDDSVAADQMIAELHQCISNLEADRDGYKSMAYAALDQLQIAQQRVDYLEQQADRLFDENRLLRSRSLPGSGREKHRRAA